MNHGDDAHEPVAPGPIITVPGQLSLPTCTVVPPIKGLRAEREGLLPDMAGWHKGDLLLFRAEGPTGALIERVQRAKWGDDGRWSHVAMYVGEGMAVEAILGKPPRMIGVKERSLASYSPHREMLRLHDRELDEAARELLVRTVKKISGTYSIPRLIAAGFWGVIPASLRPERDAHERVERYRGGVRAVRAYICSDVIEAAYSETIEESAAPSATEGIVPPAAFAASPRFDRHAVTLCRLVGAPS